MTSSDTDRDAQIRRALSDMEDVDEPAEVDIDPDRTQETRTPGFSRMRTRYAWSEPDAQIVRDLQHYADRVIHQQFDEAFQVQVEIYWEVREPEPDPQTGEVLYDEHGMPIWRRTPSGAFREDWSRLSYRKRDDLLYRITTHLFEWEQYAAAEWGNAMFAKGQWEEVFANAFVADVEGMRDTIDARTQQARAASIEERYRAIFRALVSRKADAVVRSMSLLQQRLKDTRQ